MKCLSPGCFRLGAKARGLCGSCYNRLACLVRAGQTTWEALAAAGLVLPATSLLTRSKAAPARLGLHRRRQQQVQTEETNQ